MRVVLCWPCSGRLWTQSLIALANPHRPRPFVLSRRSQGTVKIFVFNLVTHILVAVTANWLLLARNAGKWTSQEASGLREDQKWRILPMEPQSAQLSATLAAPLGCGFCQRAERQTRRHCNVVGRHGLTWLGCSLHGCRCTEIKSYRRNPETILTGLSRSSLSISYLKKS